MFPPLYSSTTDGRVSVSLSAQTLTYEPICIHIVTVFEVDRDIVWLQRVFPFQICPELLESLFDLQTHHYLPRLLYLCQGPQLCKLHAQQVNYYM